MEEKYLKFAKNIAKVANKIMKKYSNIDSAIDYKLDNTIVTKADKEINEYLIQKVNSTFPTHSVDGEENQFGKSDYVWVCDPVDGTAMYARHIPTSVFSLALVVKGEPIVGVILDPWTNSLYSAIKGKGAYKNNKRIYVSDIALDDMRSVAHYDMHPAFEYNIYNAIKLLAEKTYFTSIGSVARACCCVANGDFTCAIFPGTEHKNCDVAAAKVIVEEAGGVVTNLFGKKQKYNKDIKGVIVSNKVVYKEVLNALKEKM